jgi:hypothetical protein
MAAIHFNISSSSHFYNYELLRPMLCAYNEAIYWNYEEIMEIKENLCFLCECWLYYALLPVTPVKMTYNSRLLTHEEER